MVAQELRIGNLIEQGVIEMMSQNAVWINEKLFYFIQFHWTEKNTAKHAELLFVYHTVQMLKNKKYSPK